MTQSHTPTIHCDGDDAFCGAWDIDHYETGASTVNGVQITRAERSPGWLTNGDEDYCPEHKSEAEAGSDDH